jgi:hypothetical protein
MMINPAEWLSFDIADRQELIRLTAAENLQTQRKRALSAGKQLKSSRVKSMYILSQLR